MLERNRSLNEAILKSLCLLDNEISKNINPISSDGLKAMTEIFGYIKSNGIIFQYSTQVNTKVNEMRLKGLSSIMKYLSMFGW